MSAETRRPPGLLELVCEELTALMRSNRLLEELVDESSRAQDAKSSEVVLLKHELETAREALRDAVTAQSNLRKETTQLREEIVRLTANLAMFRVREASVTGVEPVRRHGPQYNPANKPSRRGTCEARGCRRLTTASFFVPVGSGMRAARLCPECRTKPDIKLKTTEKHEREETLYASSGIHLKGAECGAVRCKRTTTDSFLVPAGSPMNRTLRAVPLCLKCRTKPDIKLKLAVDVQAAKERRKEKEKHEVPV